MLSPWIGTCQVVPDTRSSTRWSRLSRRRFSIRTSCRPQRRPSQLSIYYFGAAWVSPRLSGKGRKVRTALTDLLYRRYPRLYASRHLPVHDGRMPWEAELRAFSR